MKSKREIQLEKILAQVIQLYLEIKTYSKNQSEAGFRSFYLSPSKDSKINKDAFHLLVSFEISQKNNNYIPKSFKVVDLYGLSCDMKSEFNSNNKRLYEKNRILIEGNESNFKLIN